VKAIVERTQYLKTLLDRIQNPQKALDQIGKKFVQSTRNRITNTKESPNGKPWAPWSLATLVGRLRRGTAGSGLLYETGNLADSIQSKVQGKTAVVFSNAPYAGFLQAGTDRMPARPFIGVSASDLQLVEVILRRHLRNDK
jgi:phage virion morphogenesis protein